MLSIRDHVRVEDVKQPIDRKKIFYLSSFLELHIDGLRNRIMNIPCSS